jgi:hypothetical protein
MMRKPRVKRPRKEKIKGYDSVWEYILHDTLLKDWSHHADKVSYTIPHTYEPDFTRTLQNKQILLESKGRFWDHAEYSKYIWVKKHLPKNMELVFLFANAAAPMPGAKVRKDGTKRTHGEWATANGFRWYTEDTLPDEWVDSASRETDEFNVRQQELQELEDKYAS